MPNPSANVSTSLTEDSPIKYSPSKMRTSGGPAVIVASSGTEAPSGADVFSSESSSTVQMSESVGFDTSDLTNPFFEPPQVKATQGARVRAASAVNTASQKSVSDISVGRKQSSSRMSLDSDIIVLRNPSRTCSQSDSDVIILGPEISSQMSIESDICVLPEPTNGVPPAVPTIPTVPSSGFNVTTEETLRETQSFNEQTLVSGPDELNPFGNEYLNVSETVSPCGSLTEKTVHSMVDSMYENHSRDSGSRASSTGGSMVDGSPFKPSILFTVGSQEQSHSPFVSSVDFIIGSVESNSLHSQNSSRNSPVGGAAAVSQPKKDDEETGVVEEAGIKYFYEDYKVIDHRLKLHLMMNVLGDSEEFSLVLKVRETVITTACQNDPSCW